MIIADLRPYGDELRENIHGMIYDKAIEYANGHVVNFYDVADDIMDIIQDREAELNGKKKIMNGTYTSPNLPPETSGLGEYSDRDLLAELVCRGVIWDILGTPFSVNNFYTPSIDDPYGRLQFINNNRIWVDESGTSVESYMTISEQYQRIKQLLKEEK